MSYLIFARKFRPQTFDEVVGQDAIVTTLKNAIAKNRVAQSFLFTGPRGIGKTSTARIFAKALNCERGPSPEPCNTCDACREITDGRSLDVLEIDGASNRGIDEIRSLRETVKLKPSHGRYKLYIIDEVHMLTGEAFNALLKTLEEPPEHVKFIFATTEAHKVPLTILSRCQRFNFRRVPTRTIAKQLAMVAQKEKINVKEEALFLIAKLSEGSLRDGENLLDQLAGFADGEITTKEIAVSLGLAGEEIYFSLLDSLKERDGKKTLHTIAQVVEQGKDLVQFSRGMLELFRDLLVGEDDLIEGTEERMARLRLCRGAFSREELFFSLALLEQLVRDIRWSETPRFLVETCLLKIANRAGLKSINAVLEELKSFEKNPSSARLSRSAGEPSTRTEHIQSNPSEPQKKKENLTGQILGETASSLHHAPHRTMVREDKLTASPQIPPASEKNSAQPVTFAEVGRVWPDLLEQVKTKKMSCGTFLSEAEPVDVEDGIVVFGLPSEFRFHKEALDRQDNKELVRKTLAVLLGREASVAFVITEVKLEPAARPSEPEATDAKTNDIIHSALEIFDGSKIARRE